MAAISAMLHGDKESYEKIYTVLADEVGGFVGLWSICADLAEVFTLAEAPYVAGEDYYRVEAIEQFTLDIMRLLEEGELPQAAKVRRMAMVAIEKHKVG